MLFIQHFFEINITSISYLMNVLWLNLLDGKVHKAKKVIEDIDEEKNSFTWKLVEGDLLELYKNLKIKVQCIPKDEGSVIHYALEYEKLHEGIPDSHSLLQLCAEVTKDIEAHLMGNNNDVWAIAWGMVVLLYYGIIIGYYYVLCHHEWENIVEKYYNLNVYMLLIKWE